MGKEEATPESTQRSRNVSLEVNDNLLSRRHEVWQSSHIPKSPKQNRQEGHSHLLFWNCEALLVHGGPA